MRVFLLWLWGIASQCLSDKGISFSCYIFFFNRHPIILENLFRKEISTLAAQWSKNMLWEKLFYSLMQNASLASFLLNNVLCSCRVMCLFPHYFGSHSSSSWGILLALFNTWRLSAFILAQQEVALEGPLLLALKRKSFKFAICRNLNINISKKKVSF